MQPSPLITSQSMSSNGTSTVTAMPSGTPQSPLQPIRESARESPRTSPSISSPGTPVTMHHLSQQLHSQNQHDGRQLQLQRSPSIDSAPASPTTVTHQQNNNNMVPIHMRRGSLGSIQHKPLSPQHTHHQIRKHSQGSITQIQHGLFGNGLYSNGNGSSGGGGSPLQGMHMLPQHHQHHQHQHLRKTNGASMSGDGGG